MVGVTATGACHSQPAPAAPASEGATALDGTARVLSQLEGRGQAVSADLIERAAGAMVMSWLKTAVDGTTTQVQLVRLASRVQHAFRQAAYQPHEWLPTLESMSAPEFSAFLAAIETSPVPGEGKPKSGLSSKSKQSFAARSKPAAARGGSMTRGAGRGHKERQDGRTGKP